MHVDEVQARRGAPVPEQPRLDVLEGEWLTQQRIVIQIDLPHRQIVGCTPIRVHLTQLLGGEWAFFGSRYSFLFQ